MEVEPFGEEDEFGRYGGDVVVVHLPECGEVETCIGVAFFGTAEGEHEFACFFHMGCVDVVAHEFEGEVSFDGGGEIGRGTGVLNPGTVFFALLHAEVFGDFGEAGVVFFFDEEFEEDVFRLEDGVAFEFSAPESFIGLLGEEAFDGAVD